MESSYFWVNFVAIITLIPFYILLFFYIKKQKIHIYIYSVVWVLLVVGNQIIGYPYSVNEKTLIVVYGCWLTFLIGGVFVYYTYLEGDIKYKEAAYFVPQLKLALFLTVFFSILSNYFFFKNVSSQLTGLKSLALLRGHEAREIFSAEPNMFYNLFGRSYNIYLPIAFTLYNKKYLNGTSLFLMIAVAFASAAAMFTRAPILNVLICVLVSNITTSLRYRISKLLLVTMIGFGGLVWLLTNEINTAMSNSVIVDEIPFKDSLLLYVFGGIRGYQTILEGKYVDYLITRYDVSYYTFDFFYYFSKRIGLIHEYPSIIREYIPDVPFDSNVYTYLDCFTLDFGILGALIGSCLLGMMTTFFAVHSHVYKSVYSTVIYCFCCFGLVMIFMNNEFIRSTLLIMLIPLLFIEFIGRFKITFS